MTVLHVAVNSFMPCEQWSWCYAID